MANSAVPVTSGVGTNIDTNTQSNGDHRQVVNVGDATNTDTAPVDATYGLAVDIKRNATSLEVKNLGGNTIYSNASGDFTATFTNGTKELVLSAFASAAMSAALSVRSLALGHVLKITSTGAVSTVPLTAISLVGTTFTLSDSSVNFVTGDLAAVFLVGPDKGYSAADDLFEVRDINGIEGEDTSAHVLRTHFYPVSSADYTPTVSDNTYATRVTKKVEKAAPGATYSFQVFNFGATLAYFQLHNKATAPAGADTPMAGCVWPVPPGTATTPGYLSINSWDLSPAVWHSTGVGWALSTTLATFTDSLTTTDFVVNFRRV